MIVVRLKGIGTYFIIIKLVGEVVTEFEVVVHDCRIFKTFEILWNVAELNLL